LVKALKREGVKYIFTLSGGHINPIYNSCIDEELEIIDVRHEQTAAHAAAGWARMTGEPGVAVVTAGPGVTDSISGVAEAFIAGCAMVEIGGHTPLVDIDRGALQDLNHLRLMEPITKWSRGIYDTRRIPEYVSTAFKYAKSPTPGPAYLDCPLDILLKEVEESEVHFPRKHRNFIECGASPAQIDAAVEMLMAAKRPVIIAGDGIFWSKADKELTELVELTEIPVQFSTIYSAGAIPADHPLVTGYTAVTMADTLLTLGVTFDYIANFGQPPLFSAESKFIQVNADATQIGYNREADLGIVGDPKTVITQLVEALKKTKRTNQKAWRDEIASIEQMSAGMPDPAKSDALPIHPARLSSELLQVADSDAIMVIDGGDNSAGWFSPLVKPRFMGQFMISGALGCLGAGPGFAMAAKLAHKDKQVIIFHGDGTFGLHAMEFDTFVRHNLPIVAIISNDSQWGMVKHWQSMDYGPDRCVGTCLKQRQRYDKMVEALGGHGEYVEKIEDIKPALKRAFASGKPACVNVAVDPNAVSLITTALKEAVTPKC